MPAMVTLFQAAVPETLSNTVFDMHSTASGGLAGSGVGKIAPRPAAGVSR